MNLSRLAVLLAALTLPGSGAVAETNLKVLDYSDLEGWKDDDHSAALRTFLNTCGDLKSAD